MSFFKYFQISSFLVCFTVTSSLELSEMFNLIPRRGSLIRPFCALFLSHNVTEITDKIQHPGILRTGSLLDVVAHTYNPCYSGGSQTVIPAICEE
jgi:hypothetical protein